MEVIGGLQMTVELVRDFGDVDMDSMKKSQVIDHVLKLFDEKHGDGKLALRMTRDPHCFVVEKLMEQFCS